MKITIKIGSHEITNTKREKLLGVDVDSELSFDYHISEICNRASRKVCVLVRVTSDMSLSRCAIVARITIKSIHFMKGVEESYKMISNRHLMHLEKDDCVFIHDRNIKILVTEMFTVRKI